MENFQIENNGLELNSYFFPQEIIAYILSFLDAKSLVFDCRPVCKQWQIIVDNIVWKLKVRRTNIECFSKLSYVEKMRLQLPFYVYFAAFNKNPFYRNLLKNNCGQLGLECWTGIKPMKPGNLDTSGFWSVEPIPCGSDLLPDDEDFESNTCCFASSYTLCRKKQLIDLNECGIPGIIMDKMQPTITISEWYAGRFDCGCIYELNVRLLSKEKRVLEKSEPIKRRIAQWQGREWHKVTTSFDSYGPGVRYIVFDHAGKDTLFWAGHYGSKMAGGVVKVSLPIKIRDEETIPDSLEIRHFQNVDSPSDVESTGDECNDSDDSSFWESDLSGIDT